MSQNSLVLPTTGVVSGLTMTQDTNSALDTLNTLNSGPAAPATIEGGMLWHNTTSNLLNIRSLDNTTWIPLFTISETAYSAVGASNQYIAGTVTGTANALVVATTSPTGFSLTNGCTVTLTPTQVNTGAATLNVNGTGVIPIVKASINGIVQLAPGDLSGFPGVFQYNQTLNVWFALSIVIYGYEQTSPVGSTVVTVNANSIYNNYVCTANQTYSITSSYGLLTNSWNTSYFAMGGSLTLNINASDRLNYGSTGAGITIQQGSSGTLKTDANGNLFFNINAPGLIYTASGVVGTTTNNTASAGYVGEYISNTGSVSVAATNTAYNATSISLTAGDWDVWGTVYFLSTASNVANFWEANITNSSANIGGPPGSGSYVALQTAGITAAQQTLPTGTSRFSLSTTTTLYLVVAQLFTGTATTAQGFLAARRVR